MGCRFVSVAIQGCGHSETVLVTCTLVCIQVCFTNTWVLRPSSWRCSAKTASRFHPLADSCFCGPTPLAHHPTALATSFPLPLAHLQPFKNIIERLWWNRIRQPDTIRSLLQLVYARPSAIDDSLLERIIAATKRPDALDAFTSILLSPRPELTFNEMLAALQCPVCMAYGGSVGRQQGRGRGSRGQVCGACVHRLLNSSVAL